MALGVEAARVRLVLGEHVMHRHCKDQVIAALIANGWPERESARWYRLWCDAVGVDVTASDLKRVTDGKRRELNRPLPLDTTEKPARPRPR